jgi:LysM repeat protein
MYAPSHVGAARLCESARVDLKHVEHAYSSSAMLRGWLILVSLSLALALSRPARAEGPHVHTVYRGQNLGAIAKRYNVTVAAIAYANDLADPRLIRPGTRLLIPDRHDDGGREARTLFEQRYRRSAAAARPDSSKRGRSRTRPPVIHQVAKGQRLASIARRYRVSVDAIAVANALEDPSLIRPGLLLVIPPPGANAARVREARERLIAAYTKRRNDRTRSSALRDYLLTLPHVGVGYYPNSTFVHLDVRGQKTYWVDVSHPGQPPRYASIVRLGEEG